MFGTDKDADCPLWKAPCKKDQCRWYTQILGKNPNTDEMLNKRGCAIEFLPMLLIENAQQSRQAGASIDRFKNEMVRMNGVAAVSTSILSSGPSAPQIEGRGDDQRPCGQIEALNITQ